MKILGLTCIENTRDDDGRRLISGAHDSAACIVEDGEVIAAAEEERFNRVKHTGAFPTAAVRFCLRQAKLVPDDIDAVAVGWRRQTIGDFALRAFDTQHARTILSPEDWIRAGLSGTGSTGWSKVPVRFFDHHQCHAHSVAGWFGLNDALVVTLDAYGDGASGNVWTWEDGVGALREAMPVSQGSLGMAYLAGCRLLGYGEFDEYKAMGLAPYGNPAVFRDIFDAIMTPSSPGQVQTPPLGEMMHVLSAAVPDVLDAPAAASPSRLHKDIAAGLQSAFEEVFIQFLQHHADKTGKKTLALAGGVSQNCAAVGTLLGRGVFEQVFIGPASHDGGLCLGAAWAAADRGPAKRPDQLRPHPPRSPYLGQDIAEKDALGDELAAWVTQVPGLSMDYHDDIAGPAADVLAQGDVIGWVQGRAEFGPRALGHRSILADPRPEGNRSRINQMIKSRETFRPFAPLTLQDFVADYFETPECQTPLDYMNVVLKVHPQQRSRLGAVTHVDGTARVQTLNDHCAAATRRLILRFHDLTGCGVLLNTSFNNHAEPIVNDVQDAMATFLTTQLPHMAVGGFFLTKQTDVSPSDLAPFRVRLPRHRRLVVGGGQRAAEIQPTRKAPSITPGSFRVSGLLCRLFTGSEDDLPLSQRLEACGVEKAVQREALFAELMELWRNRAVEILPGPTARPQDGGKMAQPTP